MPPYIFPIQLLYSFLLGVIISYLTYRQKNTFRNKEFIYIPNFCRCGGREYNPLLKLPLLWYILRKGRCRNCYEKLNPGRLMWEISVGLLFVLLYLTNGIGAEFYLKAVTFSLILLITPPFFANLMVNIKTLVFMGLIIALFVYSGLIPAMRGVVGYILVLGIFIFAGERDRFFIVPMVIITFLGISYLLLVIPLYILFILLERNFNFFNKVYFVASALSAIILYEFVEFYLTDLL